MARPTQPDLDDYSPSVTLIPFDRPVPLLRGPIRAGPLDHPTSGPFLLAFKDPQSWFAAYRTCESQIIQQCQSGARIGCSISASDKCRPPWWKTLLGSLSKQGLAERAKCEEREMASCMEASREKCVVFAKEKCFPAFKDARIAAKGLHLKLDWREVTNVISWVSMADKGLRIEALRPSMGWAELKAQLDVTNYRGSDLFDSDNISIDDYLKASSKRK